MKQLVFVVEEEFDVCELARQHLEEAGYSVRTFPTVRMIHEAENRRPVLLLIALMMPDGNGFDLCRRIRDSGILATTPVIFLIPQSSEHHRAFALECGADDCIIKPFSPRELVARVQAVLRRFNIESGRHSIETADLVIDSLAMKVSVRGFEVPTTSLEFRLIEYLARHRGQVFTRDLLLDAVWGDMEFVTPRSVDACIRRVRGKIEPDRTIPTYLKTIRGVGYRLDAVATWQSTPSEGCDCIACTSAVGASQLSYLSSPKRRRTPAQVKG